MVFNLNKMADLSNREESPSVNVYDGVMNKIGQVSEVEESSMRNMALISTIAALIFVTVGIFCRDIGRADPLDEFYQAIAWVDADMIE